MTSSLMDSFLMREKAILVTGAGSGIGRAIALTLAQAGAKLIFLAGRRLKPLQETAFMMQSKYANCQSVVIEADVSCSTGHLAILEKIAAFGFLDAIINNAGVFSGASLEEISDEEWKSNFSVNVFGPFKLIQEFLPLLKKSDNPSVVNISSTLAVKPIPNSVAYCSSKAALIQMTKCLALELAPHKIRVNCIMPAIVETKMYQERFTDESKYLEGLKIAAEMHPLKRVGQPQDIANAALFLVSQAASWITGATLAVDGGMLVT